MEKKIFIIFFKQDFLLLTLAFPRAKAKGNEPSYWPCKKYVNGEAGRGPMKKYVNGEAGRGPIKKVTKNDILGGGVIKKMIPLF